MKKYCIFSRVCCNKSAANSSLAFRATWSDWWMNSKAFTILNTRWFVGFYFGLWLPKHWKIRIALRQWRSNFPRREENQNTERKTESYVFSGFGNGILAAKTTTGRFATGRFWPCIWKISSFGAEQVNNWEFRMLKIMSTVCFCSAPTHFFM